VSETALRNYLRKIEKIYQTGIATEHTYRSSLQEFLEAFFPGIIATNEPRRIKCGAPDYIITKEQVPLGHIEAKDIGKPLAQIESDSEKAQPTTQEGQQFKRYREGLPNLILTNYLEFRWYVKGRRELTGSLAILKEKKKLIPDKEGTEQVKRILQSFMQATTPTVSSPRELAERMAALAKLICTTIELAFEDKEEGAGSLQSQLEGFKQVLLPDLTPKTFADMYAQTICYGIFAARCNHTSGTFTRRGAVNDIPETNPFLRKMFNYIAGIELDERVNWTVDSLAELLNRADINTILQDFGKHTRQEDPIVHFYETFLAAYNPALREKRGVYYTPEPVVSYIVRSVDHLLKTTFDLTDGLADISKLQGKTADGKVVAETHRVQILDPATGTATFLHGVIDHIHESFAGNEGMWSSYVSRHLLPRIFGFELLMAPYAVAHMKLGLQLKETGYNFKSKERLRVYLTNSLEESYEHGHLPFAEWLVEEATAAGYVKQDVPVMVVLGNPPYAGTSANNGTWIKELLHGRGTHAGNYFEVDGKPLNERNPKALYNDYVKFIRFAQWRIEHTGYGILAFITDNSYLDGVIHRGMRQSLMLSFDEIYIVDLHGNSNKRERSPDGLPDQNVFDIQEGVAISIFVRHLEHQRGHATVHHAHLWGPREDKYHILSNNNTATTRWTALTPRSPFCLFTPQDTDLKAEYERGWKITDIYPVHSSCMNTLHDGFAISFDKTSLEAMLRDAADKGISDDAFREKYQVVDSRDWKLSKLRGGLTKAGAYELMGKIRACLYRPFDRRWIVLDDAVVGYARWETTKHFLSAKSLGLVTTRQTLQTIACLPSRIPFGQHKIVDPYHRSYVFPLYLYPDPPKKGLFDTIAPATPTADRSPNFSQTFISDISSKMNMQFIQDWKGDLQKTLGPEDIFNYMYALFHSPTYRTRYVEFFKTDFPHLPLTSNPDLFRILCGLGTQLVSLHLMERKLQSITNFNNKGSDTIEIVRYTEPEQDSQQGCIWINREQYFEGVPPEAWNFQIGGYKVCQQWLKDRKGHKLEYEDIWHYQQIIALLMETIRVMGEIDSTIIAHGGWPIE